MRILLPPSETKRSGGGGVFAPESLAHDRALRKPRSQVRRALLELCRDEEAAAKALKLGVKNRGEIGRNRALRRPAAAPAMSAIERYTGVLYDALDPLHLDAGARAWIAANVSVQSALFGLIDADDAIPAYRLSASTRLPGLGTPLANLWRDAHEGVDWGGLGWILDMRSKDYAQLAPLPPGAGVFLHVAQRDGVDDSVRALNHFNKAAKGLLLRRLAISSSGGAAIGSAEDLVAWAATEGIELELAPDRGEATLVLPAREAGAPPGAVLAAVSAG